MAPATQVGRGPHEGGEPVQAQDVEPEALLGGDPPAADLRLALSAELAARAGDEQVGPAGGGLAAVGLVVAQHPHAAYAGVEALQPLVEALDPSLLVAPDVDDDLADEDVFGPFEW